MIVVVAICVDILVMATGSVILVAETSPVCKMLSRRRGLACAMITTVCENDCISPRQEDMISNLHVQADFDEYCHRAYDQGHL